MARRIGGSNQHGVFSEPEMGEVRGLGKNVEVSCGWGLYFREHFLEVLNEHVMQSPTELDGFLTNHFETFVQRFQIFLRDKCPCFQSLFYVRILGCLTDLFIDFGGSLSIVSRIAKEHEENFFRI